ncbi:MAG: hypothetical protein FJ276_24255 [Planctomycetes bacterium]|nr:hypothetical protein [Planctomycetota bacterium]
MLEAAQIVDRAFQLFCCFRKQHDDVLAPACRLIPAVAREHRADRDAALAYIEYLSLAKKSAVADPSDVDAVLASLQSCCGNRTAESRQLNQIAKEVCEFAWASQNLMHIYSAEGHFKQALEEAEYCGALTRTDPQTAFDLGMIYRGLGKWGRATDRFAGAARDDVSEAPPLQDRSAARVYCLEAQLRGSDVGLAEGWAATDHLHLWQQWQAELVGILCDGPVPAEGAAIEVAQTVILEVERRVHLPGETLQILPRLLAGHLSPAAVTIVSQILVEGGQHPLDRDPLPPTETCDANRLCHVRYQLSCGRTSPAREVFAAAEAPAAALDGLLRAAARLLRADVSIRTGHADAAFGILFENDWSATPFFSAAFELQVEYLLDQEQLDEARQRLEQPAAHRLPLLTCRLALARLAASQGDWQSAWNQYQQLLTAEPRAPRVLAASGWFALTLGQDAFAEQVFQSLLHTDPRHCYAQVGYQLAAHGRSADWDALFEAEPALRDLTVPLVKQLRRAGRWDLANELETAAHDQVT